MTYTHTHTQRPHGHAEDHNHVRDVYSCTLRLYERKGGSGWFSLVFLAWFLQCIRVHAGATDSHQTVTFVKP